MELHAQIACSMPRDPRMIAAGWQARAVYTEAVLYCRENLTDGLIDRRALVFWMPDMSTRTRAKHLDALANVGALTICDEGWRFPEHVWRRWNPSRAEVDTRRAEEAARKQEYRERKRRERDEMSQQDTDRTPVPVPDGQRVGATSRDRQPEPEPEPEPEPSSARGGTSAGTSSRPDPRASEAITEHLAVLADRGMVRNAGGLRRSIERDDGPRLAAWLTDHPDATALDAAVAVLGTPKPKAPVVDAVTGLRMSPYAQ